jgi:hypothetical protein
MYILSAQQATPAGCRVENTVIDNSFDKWRGDKIVEYRVKEGISSLETF